MAQKIEMEATQPTNSHLRRAIAAAAIGNCMEWFDFGVYSYVAALIGKVFFPAGSTTNQLLFSFGAFAIAFLARPFGGIFFGPLGDKIGRQRVLATTILLMAGSTFVVGVLPGYAAIGIWAPLLLVLARLVQGFSTGGEYSGAATFMVEYAPTKRRGFYCSWLEFGTLTGFALGAALVIVCTTVLSPAQMSSWGWRVPFLLAAPLGIIGLYLRYQLEDTPAFRKLQQSESLSKAPLREVITRHWRELLIVTGFVILLNVADYEFLAYMPSYLQHTLHMGAKMGLLLPFLIMVVMMFLVVPVGWLVDHLGGKNILLASCVGFLLLSYPAIRLMSAGGIVSALGGLFIIGFLLVLLLGTEPSMLSPQFPTRVRYGGFSIAYNVSTSAFGGTAALVVTWLVKVTGNADMPAYYLMAAAAAALVPILLMRRTTGRPLIGSETPANTRRPRQRIAENQLSEQQ